MALIPKKRVACAARAFLLGVATVALCHAATARTRAVRAPAPPAFNYSEIINGGGSLNVSVTVASGGVVSVNGGDSRQPVQPFVFAWGDGTSSSGFFPQSHTYADTSRNYVMAVIASYGSAQSSRRAVVRFAQPHVTSVALDSRYRVSVAEVVPPLSTHLYPPPAGLTGVDDQAFTRVSRVVLQQVLSAAAAVEAGFVDGDVYAPNGSFNQVVLLDPKLAGGAYSLWFLDPVALAVSRSLLSGDVDYSSLFHEMGHNVTLNMPSGFYYGGRIDGNANTIYSETMAQIFQHATAYEIVNNAARYGIPDDLALDIQNTAQSSAALLADRYRHYLAEGKQFRSWNDPATPADETFDTFMTLGYKFIELAEAAGVGYAAPAMRMSAVLRAFAPSWQARYSQDADSPAAEQFRATLMVAAMSYGFDTDLRQEFRALGFPIDDLAYQEIVSAAKR